MSSEAVKKRKYRLEQKEKRRRSFFVDEYVRIKYPQIYTEVSEIYQQMVDKYPGKCDFTKTYYFRKWVDSVNKTDKTLFLPRLPILQLPETLKEVTQQQAAEQHEPPAVGHVIEVETFQSPHEPPVVGHTIEVESSQTPHEPHVVGHTIEVESSQTPHEPPPCSGMSLDDMQIAVDEITRILQSDRDLMDIVENLDLPDSLWDNDLVTPDYVLEGDNAW